MYVGTSNSLCDALIYGIDNSGLKHIHVFTLQGFIASEAAGQGILNGLPVGFVCFPSRIVLWYLGWTSIQ